ncbi:MAG TPA: alanine dehydrogenase [Virgibacillus sp.]|nr:alanine dehydrogenase [Virgibacillus sp.]
MKIGVPKEIMSSENRVGMTPAVVLSLTNAGHDVFVETKAGEGSGFTDGEYAEAGATITLTAKEAWAQEMIMKVKDPLPEEFDYFYEGLVIFAYFHLAAEKELTKELVAKKVVAIAYETVQLENRSLPLLTPMSEVAGYLATQIGSEYLKKSKGGKGVLLAGIPGVERGKVTVIGGGVVGTNAVKMAVGLGAMVTVIDLSSERLKQLDDLFGSQINTIISNPMNIAKEVASADVVIGAVLIPGAKAPTLVTEEMVKTMEPGSVIVDVAIDQGGIFETSDRMTTHENPTYTKHGVLHYAVSNIPGNVPRTATIGLTNVTAPYALQIANKGYEQACLDDPALLKGLNTMDGSITSKAVADAHGLAYKEVEELLKN